MPQVHGRGVDEQTRCAHWHGPSDVIAIRFRCCGRYYACFECHSELESHDAQRWPAAGFSEAAVLCGVCRTELTISAYLDGGYACPSCGAAFNPGCSKHHHLYFEVAAAADGC